MRQHVPAIISCAALTVGLPALGQSGADDDAFAGIDPRCLETSEWEKVRPDRYYLDDDNFGLDPHYGAESLVEAARRELGDEEARVDMLHAARCKKPAALFFLGWLSDMEGRASDRESEKVTHQRRAFGFYELAAQAGYAWAESNICTRLMRGYGASPNHADAFKWCQSAASKGAVHAQSSLAVMYWNGIGVEKDISEAYFWYLVALPELPGAPMLDRTSAEQRLREAEKQISRQQIDQLQRRASEFHPSQDWREQL